ncbi:MAG TPA: hypothetical protein VGK67_10090 [Myxococcales bacterium]
MLVEPFGGPRALYRPEVPVPLPVPDWLARRPSAEVRWLPSQRGYAIHEAGSCAIEVFDPEGGECGTLDLTPAGGCSADTLLTLGVDGSVVRQQGCGLDVFRRLLR